MTSSALKLIKLFLLLICNGQLSRQQNDLTDELIKNVYNISSGGSQNVDSECQCVLIKDCPGYPTTYTDGPNYGEGLVDPRIRECYDPYKVCCPNPSTESTVTLPPEEYQPPPPTPDYNPTESPPTGINKPIDANIPSCGYRNERGAIAKVRLQKTDSKFGEFPWMIALLGISFQEDYTVFKFQCGGSLIHSRVVLTAAHCVKSYIDKPEMLVARAGEWDARSSDEPLPYKDESCDKIIIHEKYVAGPELNDIALVILKNDFEFVENINTICLPPQDEDINGDCIATGWGQLKVDQADIHIYDSVLQKIDLPIVPRTRCQDELRKTRLRQNFILHEGFLCAGGVEGVDTCKGDGGSPLICPIPGKNDYYYQAGIVSWGIGCGSNVPGVYVSIPRFKIWIDDQLLNNGLAPNYTH